MEGYLPQYNNGRRIKVYNRIFMDATHDFSMLKFYYGHMVDSLRKSSDDFHEFTERLEVEGKNRQRNFDKKYWLKHYDVYTKMYPRYFNNSFIISACALFEHNINGICDLVKEEHKVPLELGDMNGSVPSKVKGFLWNGGILLKDDPPTIVFSPPDFIPIEVFNEKRILADVLWRDIEYYFKVRNCIAHYGGLIQKLRYPEKVIKYAIKKGILVDNSGQSELVLNQSFNEEVCDTMQLFFQRLSSAYYSTPLPE